MGNRNALKHGKYAREIRDLCRCVREHIRECRALIAWAKAIDALCGRPRVFITEYVVDGVTTRVRETRVQCSAGDGGAFSAG